MNIAIRKKKPGFVYLAYSESGHHKIGVTTVPEKRIRTFTTELPFEVSLLHSFPADDTIAAERRLHKKFSDKHVRGEWFILLPKDVQVIQSISRFEDSCFM